MIPLVSTSGYAEEAEDLFIRYESRDHDALYSDVVDWFPSANASCDILDIGAGTGRDAAYFARQGHRVLAVEPVDIMRTRAAALHTEAGITWLKDSLPRLQHTLSTEQKFDFVMMNAVWMHFDKIERRAGMRTIANLMTHGARLFMTLRHGPVPKGRRMFDVSGEETIDLAKNHGLKALYSARQGSIQSENKARAIEWTRLVFEKQA